VIGYYAHHHGSGHITRLQSITACLHESVWGLSSLQAPAGWTQPWTQLARDDTPSPSAAAAAGDVTAGGVLHWAPPLHEGLSARMAQLAEWIAQHRPQLLVVDVSVEVALLARLCGVPTVVVALPGRRLDRPHRLAQTTGRRRGRTRCGVWAESLASMAGLRHLSEWAPAVPGARSSCCGAAAAGRLTETRWQLPARRPPTGTGSSATPRRPRPPTSGASWPQRMSW
jgi:hypothetical protein